MPGGMAVRPKSSVNIFSLIAFLLFFVAVLSSAGAFLYGRFLTSSNEEKRQQIQAEISAFDPTLTQELSLVKARMDAATDLLNRHLALSAFFSMLQRATISTVQLTSFSYAENTAGRLSVVMDGVARSFNDIVFQSDTMAADPNLKNVTFSSFALDTNGNVRFAINMEIEPANISYQKLIQNLSLPPAQVPQQSQTQQSTSTPAQSATTTPSQTSTSTATTTTP